MPPVHADQEILRERVLAHPDPQTVGAAEAGREPPTPPSVAA